ncbi:hypothetical protein [Methanospirillum lacunae]|uniref:Cohesin domain-containing protein n=1 Tax=Methanospirillum lacunae TaxID=668570 RepID=A0A2V2NEW4_9EURY|nr:hypothetical protein [Methanospirillum lacunae]PWR74131.1 hypothetical protein DK846_02960 [Methanospirillum lacunae]
MVKLAHFLELIAVFFFISIFSTPALALSQPVLFFSPDLVESNTGDNVQVHLLMDGASRGLSGYGLIISLDTPDIVDIIGIDLPKWTGLQDIEKQSDSSYLIQGVDSNDNQHPGAPKIDLATVKVHAKAPGYATIRATPVMIDDDQKGRYETSPVAMTIVITGAGPVPLVPMST